MYNTYADLPKGKLGLWGIAATQGTPTKKGRRSLLAIVRLEELN